MEQSELDIPLKTAEVKKRQAYPAFTIIFFIAIGQRRTMSCFSSVKKRFILGRFSSQFRAAALCVSPL